MKKPTHSPGPWIQLQSYLSDAFYIFSNQDKAEKPSPICMTIASEHEGHNPNSNARLIAASPEMYDILVEIALETDDETWLSKINELLCKINGHSKLPSTKSAKKRMINAHRS